MGVRAWWTERKNGETQRFEGALSGFEVSRADAEQMILTARIKAGWIEEDAPVEDEADVESDGEGETEPVGA